MNNNPSSFSHPNLGKMSANEFGFVIQYYQDSIFRYFLVSTKNHAIAEELSQDTFLKAWKERKKYDSTKNFASWLFAIGRNNLLDFKRKEKLRLKEHEHIKQDDKIKNEDFEELHLAIENLNPDEKRIIEMRYFEQQSCQDIANALGKTDNAISLNLFKIRQKIHDFFKRKSNE